MANDPTRTLVAVSAANVAAVVRGMARAAGVVQCQTPRSTEGPLMDRHKYHAVPTVVDGIKFPSKREARRFGELKLLERAGQIRDLELQPKFVLHAPGGEKVGAYIADFRYVDVRTGETTIEDAKGFRNPLYLWKRRHVQAEYGVVIREV